MILFYLLQDYKIEKITRYFLSEESTKVCSVTVGRGLCRPQERFTRQGIQTKFDVSCIIRASGDYWDQILQHQEL